MTRTLPNKLYAAVYLGLWLPAVAALIWAPLWLYAVLVVAPVTFALWAKPVVPWQPFRRRSTLVTAATDPATAVAPCCGEDAARGCCEAPALLRKDDNPA